MDTLPTQFANYQDYALALVSYLKKYSFLYNYYLYTEQKFAIDACQEQKVQHVDGTFEKMVVQDEERGIHFLLMHHWERRIPQEWRQFLQQLPLESLAQIPSRTLDMSNFPKSLQEFIFDSQQLALAGVSELQDTSQEKMDKILLRGMNQKKQHEVDLMGKYVIEYAKSCDCSTVADIGAGQGYLSQYITFKQQLEGKQDIQIIAIDGDKLQVEGAQKKCEKKVKQIKRNLKDAPNAAATTFSAVAAHLSLTISHAEFLELLKPHLAKQKENQRILMIGLHTCGDLACTMMKLFLQTDSVALINAGCCYHRVTEDPNYLCADVMDCGYPMSNLLKQHKLPLSSGKFLASGYSLNESTNLDALRYNYKMQSYRAAIEQLFYDLLPIAEPESHHVGNCPETHSSSFAKYAMFLLPKLLKRPTHYKDKNHEAQINAKVQEYLTKEPAVLEKELNEYYKKFNPVEGDCIYGIAIYTTLRLILCPILEALLLTDRLLFLQDQPQVAKASLVRLFHPTISPRGILLTAIKK